MRAVLGAMIYRGGVAIVRTTASPVAGIYSIVRGLASHNRFARSPVWLDGCLSRTARRGQFFQWPWQQFLSRHLGASHEHKDRFHSGDFRELLEQKNDQPQESAQLPYTCAQLLYCSEQAPLCTFLRVSAVSKARGGEGVAGH